MRNRSCICESNDIKASRWSISIRTLALTFPTTEGMNPQVHNLTESTSPYPCPTSLFYFYQWGFLFPKLPLTLNPMKLIPRGFHAENYSSHVIDNYFPPFIYIQSGIVLLYTCSSGGWHFSPSRPRPMNNSQLLTVSFHHHLPLPSFLAAEHWLSVTGIKTGRSQLSDTVTTENFRAWPTGTSVLDGNYRK